MKYLVKTYNRIAEEYGKFNYNRYWTKELPMFKKFIKTMQGRKVIDIGCGAGRDAEEFVKNKFDYTGIDFSPAMLRVAKRRVPKAKFILMDFYKLKFPKESFEGFWASASLLHIPKKKLPKVLHSIWRLLKPHGVGFISVQKKKDLDQGIIVKDAFGGRIKKVKRFYAYYTKPEMKRVLEGSGFKVVNYTTKYETGRDLTWLCFFVRKK